MREQQSSGHGPETRQTALATRFEQQVPARVNADGYLVQRGRTLSGDCMVHIGAVPFLLRIEQGRIAACTRHMPLFSNVLLTIKGSLAAWAALWEPMPQPGWHDIFALCKRGEMTVEGQMQPLFAHLQYIKDVLNTPRSEAMP